MALAAGSPTPRIYFQGMHLPRTLKALAKETVADGSAAGGREAMEKPGKPKAHGSRADEAYGAIKDLILTNVWTPGYNEFEPEIALKLGMSRTPVREALVRLEKEGLIRLVPRRGVYVLPISPDDIRDIYFVLAGLEASAAEQLAGSENVRELVGGMRDAIGQMDRALAAEDLAEWAKGDVTFHRLLVEQSGNKRLAEIVSMVNDQAHRARMITLRLRPFPNSSNEEHKAILSAIEAGDRNTSSRLVRDHRLKGTEMVRSALSNLQLKQL